MFTKKRKLYSQNFLYNRKLVQHLVSGSSIAKNDLVLEIGPGEGIITNELVKSSRFVVAVEIDTEKYAYLKQKFNRINNLTLYLGDFLDFELPSLPYKVFANIPFSTEGKIIRKL